MANEIYTKATGYGSDDCLILDAKTSFKRQFPMGDDWTQIHVGAFISYTASLTDPNIAPEGDLISGRTTNETFSYIGVSKYAAPNNFLPERGAITASANEAFTGYKFGVLDDSSNTLGEQNGGNDGHLIHNRYDGHASSSSYAMYVHDHTNAFSGMASTNNFAFYIGFDIVKRVDQGVNVLSVGITNSGASGIPVGITNVTMQRLKDTMDAKLTNNYSLNIPSDGTGLPDSFFFYNAFTNARMRIHSLAVKKVS